jgi:O-antigen/teichoic acid export membrane protein
LSKQIVGKGALYIYLETLVSMGSGYLFWIILSKISSPNAIGISSTIVSLITIFSTIASLGIPQGVQRFLGKGFSERKSDIVNQYIKSSFILTVIGIISCVFVFIILQKWFYYTFEIDIYLLIVSVLLIGSTTIMTLFRSVVISSLNTKMLPLIMIVGTIFKIVLAYVLVIHNFGALGIISGFAFFPIFSTFCYSAIVLKFIKDKKQKFVISSLKSYRDLFVSSVANWIPTVIYTMGSHLGTLLVFGSHGSTEAGVYFIAFSLSMAITALMSALFTIAYPTLSSMKDGRKRFTGRTIKISLIFSMPFSLAIMFYSKEVLSIFGPTYSNGSSTLEILLISTLPMTILTGINNLAYSYGHYRQVLFIGLASNLPRAIFYFTLVPYLDGIGASMSYTIGSLFGLVVSLIISKKNKLTLVWKDTAYITIIPLTVLLVLNFVHLSFVFGFMICLILSYILYLKTNLIDKTDLLDSINIFPSRITHSLLWLINSLNKGNKL